ncbi:MAG TPA: WecB/TagA/CpsF family glycosyltransferase [Acidimicrobiia bacterium]|nr:WecB/TagA/CpsF family glycosyltransferase [Acidimicrobiia bacterium]
MDREAGSGSLLTRVDVLGVEVSAIDLPEAVVRIGSWIRSGDRQYVCVTGVHGVIEAQRDPSLKEIHNRAGMVTPDGMPLVWCGRWAGVTDIDRVYGPDLMVAVMAASTDQGWRHYFYGAGPGIAEQLAERLSLRFPGLKVAGTHTPPFRELTDGECSAIADEINSSGADIVWVGLSTPKQERWMARMRPLLTVPVLIGVGAAFDMHAGNLRQAPRWMQRSGLEWLYRLSREPRRLWRRYAVIIPSFLFSIARRRPVIVTEVRVG